MTKSTQKTIIFASLGSILMFGFSFALAPLYQVFCKTTKLNNSVRIISSENSSQNASAVQRGRQVKVQFISVNNKNLLWDFYPFTSEISVHPEETIKVVFHAKNTTNKTMTVQAVPSFAPQVSAQYFHKIQCFCFNQQTLKAGESINLPVVFRVDKDLPASVNVITLAYTLFDLSTRRTHL